MSLQAIEAGNKIISTISNKGGVGKTLFSIELANNLGKIGKKVLLIDTDINTGDIAIKLGIRSVRTLLDFFEKQVNDLDSLVRFEYHFRLIPGAGGNFKFANINYAQKMRFIRAFRRIAHNYDFTILDLGAGIDRTTLDFALIADYPIIITTPEDVQSGYGCAKAAAERLANLNGKMKNLHPGSAHSDEFSPYFVFNKSEKSIAQGIYNGIRRAVEVTQSQYDIAIKPEYLGSVSRDYRLVKRTYIAQHRPISEVYPNSEMGREYCHIAQHFINDEYREKADNNRRFNWLFKLFSENEEPN